MYVSLLFVSLPLMLLSVLSPNRIFFFFEKFPFVPCVVGEPGFVGLLGNLTVFSGVNLSNIFCGSSLN